MPHSHSLCAGHRRRLSRLVALALTLCVAACASAPPAPQIQRLTTQSFPATQIVDVLDTPPAGQAYTAIARLTVSDPTGAATQAQLIAQLVDTARNLGADALVIERVDHQSATQVAFNPSGGQMQGGEQTTSLTVSALAIRTSR